MNTKQIFSLNKCSHCYYLYKKNRLTLSHCLQILLDLICEQMAKKNKKYLLQAICQQKVCCGHSLANVDLIFSDF
jgi:hypothetical protein